MIFSAMKEIPSFTKMIGVRSTEDLLGTVENRVVLEDYFLRSVEDLLGRKEDHYRRAEDLLRPGEDPLAGTFRTR